MPGLKEILGEELYKEFRRYCREKDVGLFQQLRIIVSSFLEGKPVKAKVKKEEKCHAEKLKNDLIKIENRLNKLEEKVDEIYDLLQRTYNAIIYLQKK